MVSFTKLFLGFALVYATVFLIATNFYEKDPDDGNLRESRNFFMTQDQIDEYDIYETGDSYEGKASFTDRFDSKGEIEDSPSRKQREVEASTSPKKVKKVKKIIKSDPFTVLGAYADPSPYVKNPLYNKPHYGLINDDDYCAKVDQYNLKHPKNMFKTMNFYTDYMKGSVMKNNVMSKIGKLFNENVIKGLPKKVSDSRKFNFDQKITNFHLAGDQFYRYHEIGKHYLCATQMFNHIPNHTTLIRKDEVLQNFEDYSLTYKNQPQCFDKNSIFPATFRLFVKNECQEFFKVMGSKQYKDSIKKEPIQYLIKVGHGAHKSQGVFLLDKEQTDTLNADYNYGKKCGKVKKPLIAQKYITNPLLLDKDNKFDLRVYMLVASTNPFIVYYHDGYLRVSINTFDKFSEDRATHLTNTFVAEQKFAEARKENKTINGMTAEELEDYHLWAFQDLEDYLYESGRITEKNWLDTYLRPSLQKAFIHLIRMTGGSFWKQSNVYELFGLDFMLDENLNLWFIECNPNPLLDGVKPKLITRMLKDLFEIEYAYYRSRMTRVLDVISKMQKASGKGPVKNLSKWRAMYREAVSNRLEPGFKVGKENTFTLIMDQSLPGAQAYFGHLKPECVKK